MLRIESHDLNLIALSVVIVLLGLTVAVSADHLVNRTPEIQGLLTVTSSNVQGTVTEADSGAWQLRDNLYFDVVGTDGPTPPYGYGPGLLTDPLTGDQALVTNGYNNNIAAVSGQTALSKVVGINTGDQIADGNNVKTSTSLQFVAMDTGRATTSEDMLIDSAANWTDPTTIFVLCPFADENEALVGIPAHCNIVQAGSSTDSTLTSMATATDGRFVGTDSAIPIALDYAINAHGISLANQSSPMIGSATAYLKVHTQEAREANLTSWDENIINTSTFASQWTIKSQDLVYSETSSASGLVSGFSKSMNYQSGLNLN